MLCCTCRGSGIMPLTDSPSRVMRRTMSRLVSIRLPCVACHGTGYVSDPAPPPPPEKDPEPEPEPPAGRHPLLEPFAALFPRLSDPEKAQFQQVFDLIGEATRTGEFSQEQAEANRRAVTDLIGAADLPVSTREGANVQSRMRDVISANKATFVRPQPETVTQRAHKTPDRGQSLLELLIPLKSFLVDQGQKPRQGRAEKDRALALLTELAHVQKAIADASDNGEVRRIEHFQLRSPAWAIRKYSLRQHLMVAEPLWGVSSVEPDATCVFFAGGAVMRADAMRFCEKRGLTLKSAPDAGGSGQLRWDLIRESVTGIFDLTVPAARARASVCHALGLSLALGRYPLVLAKAGRSLPFDIDIEAQYLTPAQARSGIVAKRLDEALFAVHRTTGESSVAATARQVPGAPRSTDGIELKAQLEHLLSPSAGTPAALLHPVWPASYPDSKHPTCFHVMPFGKDWSAVVRDKVRKAVERSGFEYRRGDQTRGVHVIRSIWDEICRASAVIVDLTGLNENVCLELGLAQAIGRPALLMTQDDIGKALFPEIAKLRVSRYSPAGADVRKIVEGWRRSVE